MQTARLPSHWVGNWIAKHIEKRGLKQGVELGDGLAAFGSQDVRHIQDRRYPLLLGDRWERNPYCFYSASCNLLETNPPVRLVDQAKQLIQRRGPRLAGFPVVELPTKPTNRPLSMQTKPMRGHRRPLSLLLAARVPPGDTVPVILSAGADLDACRGVGGVDGPDPAGDGFESMRASPGTGCSITRT